MRSLQTRNNTLRPLWNYAPAVPIAQFNIAGHNSVICKYGLLRLLHSLKTAGSGRVASAATAQFINRR